MFDRYGHGVLLLAELQELCRALRFTKLFPVVQSLEFEPPELTRGALQAVLRLDRVRDALDREERSHCWPHQVLVLERCVQLLSRGVAHTEELVVARMAFAAHGALQRCTGG